MADRIKVDAAKFDRILARMLDAKPLSKAEISAKILRERNAKAGEKLQEKNERYKNSKKLGQ